MITRCYLEITNVCNLDCVFCPKTARAKHTLTMEEFDTLTSRLKGEVKFLYFHLMGEPFLHAQLPQFVKMAKDKGFVPVLTTNGTLLSQRHDMLDALPHKIQISLHSHEGNGKADLERYIDDVMTFAIEAAHRGCVIVLRLWNEGGHNSMNDTILNLIANHVPQPWTKRYDGWKLANYLYIENDNMFEWPDLQHATYGEEEVFCYALRNQIGVLVDGRIVPCCIDCDGAITLGNIFTDDIIDVINSPLAKEVAEGFRNGKAVHPYCKKCGFVRTRL